MGYTYAMSDLHGSLSQFRQMLSLIGFSGEDRLYLIGDVFDRKPDAMALLMDVMKRENVTLLLGNHEHMMIDYVEDRLGPLQKASWLDRSGGHYTLAGFQALSSWERSLVMGYLNTRCPVFLNRVRCGERRFRLFHAGPPELAPANALPKEMTDRDSGRECEIDEEGKNRRLLEAAGLESLTLAELEKQEPLLREPLLKQVLWTRLDPGFLPQGETVFLYGHTPVFQYDPAYDDGAPARIWHDREKRKFNLDCGAAPFRPDKTKKGRIGCLRLDDLSCYYV